MLAVWMVFIPDEESVTAGYLAMWLLLLYVGYTMAMIAHQSWGAELAQSYDERSRLFGWREIFVLAGMMLVLPRMRAVASSYYVLMNTFLGLALGPYLMGQISDHYISVGVEAGEALRAAATWGLAAFLVAMFFLALATRYLPKDEGNRLERAAELGENVD